MRPPQPIGRLEQATSCDVQEAHLIAVMIPTVSFNNIRTDAIRRSNNLSAQRLPVKGRPRLNKLMDSISSSFRHLHNLKILNPSIPHNGDPPSSHHHIISSSHPLRRHRLFLVLLVRAFVGRLNRDDVLLRRDVPEELAVRGPVGQDRLGALGTGFGGVLLDETT